MSNDKEAEKTTDIEELSAGQEEHPPADTSTKDATGGGKHRFRRLLLLATAAIVFALFAVQQFAPRQFKDEYLTPLTGWLPAVKKEVTKTEMPPATAPVIEPSRLAAETETAMDTLPEMPPVREGPADTASSEEVRRLLDAMEALQQDLHALRQEQQALEEAQRSIQLMQLRTRLRWITNPANHLPQLKLAWEEIALMPLLSSGERERAEAMLALAEKRLLELRGWQQTLNRYAESLSRTEHANIIPEFENRWLNWVVEQFSLRPSLSKEEEADARLREQLINTGRNIEMEQWPEATAWLQLRATLQLRLVASENGDASSAAADLGLPESFEAAKDDINKLRQSAAAWLEQLS